MSDGRQANAPGSTLESHARRLLPTPCQFSPAEIYSDLVLPNGYDERPYVVLNAATTVDGKVAVAGRAGGIGSPLDRVLMRRVRAAADALLVGATTLRAESIDPRILPSLSAEREARGQPPQPLAVTVSNSLDLDPCHRFFVQGPTRTLVFTSERADVRRVSALSKYAQVERIGADVVDLAGLLERLRHGFGVERLLVEGGPTLNQRLLERDLVDELFWTVAPKLAGGRGLSLLHGPIGPEKIRASLDIVSLFEHQGELFARYRIRRDVQSW